MWKRYHFSVAVCEKGIAIPLGGTSLYKTSLSTPVPFWGWNRLIRAKNQLSSIKPTYIQVCWFPGSSFVPPASSSKYAAKLSASSNADTAFSTAFMTRFACPYRAFVFSSSDGGTSLNSGNRRWYSGFFSKNLRTKKYLMSLSNRGIVSLVFSDVICRGWDAVFHQEDEQEHREESWGV